MAKQPERPRPPMARTTSVDKQQEAQQRGQRGLTRAMRGLQGFAGQANAAYGKLGATIEALVEPVANLAVAFGTVRDTLRETVAAIDSCNESLSGMNMRIAALIPMMTTLNAQFTAIAGTSQIAGFTGSSALSKMSFAAAKATVTTGTFGATLATALFPLTAIAAAIGVVYVALFKWDELPFVVKALMLALSPLVGLLRALVNAFKIVTAPIRLFIGGLNLIQSAVTGTIRQIILLPVNVGKALIATSAAVVKFGSLVARTLGSVAAGAFRGLSAAAAGVSSVGNVMAGIGDQVVTAASRISRPLTDAGAKFAAAGTAAVAMAAATGLSVGAVQAFGYAAERSGVSADAMASAVASLNKSATQAATGTGEASRMIQRLGLDVGKVAAMNAETRLIVVGQAIRDLADPAERSAASVALLGSDASDLLKIFDGGAAGIGKFYAQADRLGLLMSGPQAKAAQELTKAQQTLSQSYQGLWQQLGAAVAPALTDAAEQMAYVIQAVTAWVKANPELIRQVFSIASRVVAVASAIASLGGVLAVATPQLIALGAAAAAGYLAWQRYGASIQAAAGTALQYLGDMWAGTQEVLGGIYDAIYAGDLEAAVAIAWSGAKKAWTAGLNDLSSITGDALGGILNALAAGDWKSALDQALSLIREGLTQAAGYLDTIWTGVVNKLDDVTTAIRQMVNVAIQELAKLAMAGLDKLVQASKAIEQYDPTGKLKDMRLTMQLAASTSGIAKTALTSPDAANKQLAADTAQRQTQRDADLALRNAARLASQLTMAGQRQQLADAAKLAAGGQRVAIAGQLDNQLADAAIEAFRAAQDRADAAEVDRKKRLEAAATAGGGGFGATFSAATLMSLGGKRESAADRTAKAVETLPGKMQTLIDLEKQRQAADKARMLEFTA